MISVFEACLDFLWIIYEFRVGKTPLNLIFTLEDDSGQILGKLSFWIYLIQIILILGRQTIEVRICTCPYRDLQQEEEKARQAQIKVASINTNINIKRAPPLVVANKTRSKYHENDDPFSYNTLYSTTYYWTSFQQQCLSHIFGNTMMNGVTYDFS